ncbi:FxsC C-terminal domain-containing protein [Micromonospora coriariae]|uniref:FxsC C-terminal domain-containing protein n=1 Tax=Micromonospora coriariae TaxID=285665 RepID=A0A1C4USE0_9ACTN|nr:TIR-like protein FxsC [Micromonospora coriariae]SCE74542.1 FxsC C-terminal domain-containing protein [Micromonospora coriariae]
MSPPAGRRRVAAPGTYFFLSYAHSAPPQGAQADTDVWVGKFFADLTDEVTRQAKPVAGMRIGFFDQHIPLGADWKAALAEALGAAEVFVPLYSPGYFSRPWALGEQESFRARLTAAAPARAAAGHLTPVLWIPFPPWETHPELDGALDLGRDVPEYAENGLRALCMLASYRAQYELLLSRLAGRIVHTAERRPLGPSRAPGLDEVTRPAPADPDFVVAVLAPTRDHLPALRDPAGYAASGRLWRPYGRRQELPAAEYAASTAERLGLSARTADFAQAAGLLERRPAVLLVDPWIVAAPDALGAVADLLHGLREWVVPLVVTDDDDAQDAARWATEVTELLHDAGLPQVKQACTMREFVDLMPALVTEARRQFLKHAPVVAFPPPEPVPSLRDGPPNPGPATPPDPASAPDDPATPRPHGETP